MDVAVIDRARQGDGDAFAAIYAHYQPAIRRHTGRLLRNPELAEDLTQETFIRAYQHRAQLRPEPQLRAWLYRIASNACLDTIRRSARRASIPAPTQDQNWEPATGDFAPQIAEAEAVRQALATLRPSLRVPLVLFLAQGLSCKEIAERLGISYGSVAVRLYRARRQFAQAYLRVGR